jgi:hypothetical protein
MKLHRVKLTNFRGVECREVTFAENGVTIVEGPNEVGKTAIAEGLQFAVDLPDTSQKAEVKALQPVGRDEGPEVEVSLSSGDYELVYWKRWLRRPGTTLEVKAPRQESLTGRQAHDRLEAILEETLDDDLWRALRIDQGTELILPNFSLPSMGRALDRAAGGEFADEREESLWTRIGEEYGKYWTATGQKRGTRTSLQRRVYEERERVVGLEKQLEAIESDVAELERLVTEADRLSGVLAEFQKSESEFQERLVAIERLRSEVERLDAIHSTSEALRDSVRSEWERRKGLIANLEERRKELAVLVDQVKDAEPGRALATERSEAAAAALKVADVVLREAQERRNIAIADRDYLRQLIEVEQLKERHERYIAAEELLKQAEEYLETAVVDDEVVKRIEGAYIETEKAMSAAGGAAAAVEVKALRELPLEVGDERTELAVGEVKWVRVEDEVLLTIPEIAQVRVIAGPESKGLAEERRKTEDNYRRLCEEAGVTDVSGARRAGRERQDAERNKEEALKAIERELRDLTPDVLLGKVENLRGRVAAYPKERPSEPALPADLDRAQEIEAEVSDLVKESAVALRACQDDVQGTEAALKSVQSEGDSLRAEINMARGREADAAEQLAAEREKQADEVLERAVAAAQEKETADLEALEAARAELDDADPESVEELLGNYRLATERAMGELQANRDRQNGLRSSLELRGEQGLQTSYDEAVNLLSHLEREYAGEEARAEAARVLRNTFAKHREQAHQRYIGPFKESIEQLGRIVFGSTFEVEIDRNLNIVRRTLDGVTLDVEQLSTGAREQLGVISRLACATIVSPEDGGAPVMIDDALGWSDPQRLQGMGAAIAAAGRQCQVIVLTCTPGRYSHVGNGTVVSL